LKGWGDYLVAGNLPKLALAFPKLGLICGSSLQFLKRR
jgi:hypothetical protein